MRPQETLPESGRANSRLGAGHRWARRSESVGTILGAAMRRRRTRQPVACGNTLASSMIASAIPFACVRFEWRQFGDGHKQTRSYGVHMPTISMFYGVAIQMFWTDHAPPHFHAIYAEDEALIDIRTLALIRGALPRRALALILEWAALHREELLEDWDLCATKQTPRKITPLS